MARAESEDSQVQTLLLPEHYDQSNDGLVTFSLQTGEQLTLNPDQYVILQDGLLLITDEIAQASMQSLPVMGSIRAQLSDLEQVTTIDGIVAQATPAQTLAITEGRAPRLFEEVDIERFELASHSEDQTAEHPEGWNPIDGGMLLGGTLLAVANVLSSTPQEETGSSEGEEPQGSQTPAPPPEPEFLSDAMFQALVPATARAYIGSAGDSFIGYSSASTSTPDALIDAGKGAGNSATFNMSAGGNNFLLLGDDAARNGGTLSYTGGPGDDVIEAGNVLAFSGTATFDMTAGGNNKLQAGTVAGSSGTLTYLGGPDTDELTFGDMLGGGGSSTVVLKLGDGDSAADIVYLTDDVGDSLYNNTVDIHHFNPAHDKIYIGGSPGTADVVFSDTANGVRVDWLSKVNFTLVSDTVDAADLTKIGPGAGTSLIIEGI